jgi:hypothetical protein
VYEIVNDVPPAVLPKWLQEYKSDNKKAREQSTKDKAHRKIEAVEDLKSSFERSPCVVPAGKETYLVSAGFRHEFLLRRAQVLHKEGVTEHLFEALCDVALRRCEEGAKFVETRQGEIRGIAEYVNANNVVPPLVRKPLHLRNTKPRTELSIALEAQLSKMFEEQEAWDRNVAVGVLMSHTPGFDPKSDAGRKALYLAQERLGIKTYRKKGQWSEMRKGAVKQTSWVATSAASKGTVLKSKEDNKQRNVLSSPKENLKSYASSHSHAPWEHNLGVRDERPMGIEVLPMEANIKSSDREDQGQ